MATVQLTTYEIEHDLLPAACARCGEPAAERRDLVLHVLDGWRGSQLITPALLGLLFFPPLVLWTLRYAQHVRVPLPVCAVDRRWFESRERAEKRYFFPIWTAVALVMDGVAIVDAWAGGPGVSCVGVFGVLVVALIAAGLIARGGIGITKPLKGGVRLTGVHEVFAAAQAEDRARDRVSNPARRGGHGDLRDDYDDQAG